MKIALDIHGTIDAEPSFFAGLVKLLKMYGAEIHITTGVEITQELRDQLRDWEIEYDYLFSITDYHKSIGTPIEWDEKGRPWIDNQLWDRTKADYCRKNSIDLAIDDSEEYQKYFNTPYILFTKGLVRNGG